MRNKGLDISRRFFVIVQSTTTIFFHTLIFSSLWFNYYRIQLDFPFWYRGNLILVAMYAFLLYVFTRLFGGNRLGFNRVSDVIYNNLLAVLLTNVVMFVQISLIARRVINVQLYIQTSIIQIVFLFAWSVINKWLFTKLFPPRKMIMVLGHDQGIDLKFKMDFDMSSFDIAEVVEVCEGIDHVIERVSHYKEVIISDVSSKERNRILKYCYHKSIRVFMTPKISDIIIRGSENIHLFDTPLLLANNKGLKFEQRLIKRLFDIVGSGLAIIILAIPFLIIAIFIKLQDGGPALYTQDRLTMNGKVFKIYKFRSMRVDSEKDSVARLAQKNDDRITPIGKILRLTHVDELPQIFNIFLGDMSIVGPRPERPDIAKEYAELIPEFTYRLKVKAGLTGYAQVYGQYNTTPYDKLKLDLFYIENFSFLKDINIILLTIKIMFQPEKSEGVESHQVTAINDSVNKDLI